MAIKLIIPGELPALNEIIDASKSHWSKYSKLKAEYNLLIVAKARKLPKMNRVNLTVTWYCPNRRKDKDNIMSGGMKILLDGLQAAGKLENDGWKQIGDITHRFEVDKVNPRIEVIFEEVNQ